MPLCQAGTVFLQYATQTGKSSLRQSIVRQLGRLSDFGFEGIACIKTLTEGRKLGAQAGHLCFDPLGNLGVRINSLDDVYWCEIRKMLRKKIDIIRDIVLKC